MKRDYLKPEIKTVFLRLATFITVSGGPSGNDTEHQFEGDPLPSGGGGGTDPEGSRYLRGSMWDDMN